MDPNSPRHYHDNQDQGDMMAMMRNFMRTNPNFFEAIKEELRQQIHEE